MKPIIKRAIFLLNIILALAVSSTPAADSVPHIPTIDDLLNLKIRRWRGDLARRASGLLTP